MFGIGSETVAAPQATLMATLIKGLLSQNLPWGLVLVGVFVAVTLELCGIHSLSFAVGAYLPIATTAPIFVGGLVRWWVERKTGETSESDLSAGTLFSSGLIAGGSLAGILFAGARRLHVSEPRWRSGQSTASLFEQYFAADRQRHAPGVHEENTGGHSRRRRRCSSSLAVILARFAKRKIVRSASRQRIARRLIAVIVFVALPLAFAHHLLQVLARGVVHVEEVAA